MAAGDAPVAVAVLAPLLGGCREREVGEDVLLDFWLRPGAPVDRDAVAAELTALGIAHRLGTANERDDWLESIRAFHRPFRVGPLHVRPPWTPADPGALDVVIDPGMAFGTGQHATTHGCLQLLATRRQGSVLDVGCGSGILAIAAAKLGHAPVVAVDLDPDAIAATGANAAANGVACRGAWMIVNGEPCMMCAKLIHHAGIERVLVVDGGFAGANGVEYLRNHGVDVISHEGPRDRRSSA